MSDNGESWLRSNLEDASPSVKLVAKTLDYEGELTPSQIHEKTLLPQRTVRYAISELNERNLVTSKISLMDGRKQIYSLNRKKD